MNLTISEQREIEVSHEAELRIERAKQGHLCVACLCPLDNERVIRGCHCKCHKATVRAIEQGLTTEFERMAEGKFLPKGKSGRRPSNPVTQELGEKRNVENRIAVQQYRRIAG